MFLKQAKGNRTEMRKMLDKMSVKALQKMGEKIIGNNKDIKMIQKVINDKVLDRSNLTIDKVLDYDVLRVPWINDARPKKFWKDNIKSTKENDEWYEKIRIPELLSNNFIEECKEEDLLHIIPTFVLKTVKTSGEIKFREIMDYSVLNLYIKNVSAILPKYDEIRQIIKDTQWYASIDCTKAYQRIKLDEELSKYSGIKVKDKYYRCKRMMFGMNIAPAVYQMFVYNKLLKVGNAINYLDDILVFGKTKEEVQLGIEKVMKIFENHKIEINIQKSELEPKTSIDFVGYTITQGEMYNNQKRIKKIDELFKEETKKGWRMKTWAKLLGLLNYCAIDHRFTKTILKEYKYINGITAKNRENRIKPSKKSLQNIQNTIDWMKLNVPLQKFNKRNTTDYSKREFKEDLVSVFVDSSPYACGIYITTGEYYKIEFPIELQKLTSAAAIKETIGYYFAHRICNQRIGKNKFKLFGDNKATINGIKNNTINNFRDDLYSHELFIYWVNNKHKGIAIADALSREMSNNELKLETDQQTKITGIKMERLQLNTSPKGWLSLGFGGKTFVLDATNIFSTYIPGKGINYLRANNLKHPRGFKLINLRKLVKKFKFVNHQ